MSWLRLIEESMKEKEPNIEDNAAESPEPAGAASSVPAASILERGEELLQFIKNPGGNY